MLFMWTDASILSYIKILLRAKDFIPGSYGWHLNNSELHSKQMLIFYDNIIFTLGEQSTTLTEISDLSLLRKLQTTLMGGPFLVKVT